jgi:4-hydroxy-3-methylbut-2-enyl diphosphate reductase
MLYDGTMTDTEQPAPNRQEGAGPSVAQLLGCFRSERVAEMRRAGGVWELPGGQIRLPRVFGFCRGVTLALADALQALSRHASDGRRLVLLGQIIHNPQVNALFENRGVEILTRDQCSRIEQHVGPGDVAIIPAFGVEIGIARRLGQIGCEIVDATCNDVRRLWSWAETAAGQGWGVLIYGRSLHDETVVTKSRLAAVAGAYLVAGDLDDVDRFCRMVRKADGDTPLAGQFDDEATNARTLEPFLRLAQVSQTTMLYSRTMQVRDRLGEAFVERFGPAALDDRLRFQPTVCRATQDRQTAAEQLCTSGLDCCLVVGGIGSSNSRHLYELAGRHTRAYFLESSAGLLGPDRIEAYNFQTGQFQTRSDWLGGAARPVVGVLAGASSPEVVVGDLLDRLAEFLG